MLPTAAAHSESFGMNTEIAHRIFGEHAQEAAASVQAELARLEQRLSRFISDSEIGRLNRSAGKDPVAISGETYEALCRAIRFAEISQGLFDISVGPLVSLWNYKHASDVPEEAEIRRILPLVDFHDLVLDPGAKTAKLRQPEQSIDLGGMGKGYASDRCIDILRELGVVSAFINIGGNVSALGNKPDGSPWRVGIRHPRQEGRLLGAVEATDKAVVTSGDYERYFVDREGKRRHHILNPATGYPAESGLVSVTVIADHAMTADALSTAIFVAGMDKGLDYLAHFPGVEAVLVDSHQRVFITPGMKACYQSAAGMKANVIRKEGI